MLTGRRRELTWTLIFGSALGIGCSEESAPPAASPQPAPAAAIVAEPAPAAAELSLDSLIEAGRVAYNANCIACHNLNPKKDGALGPAVAGASLELLEARVLRAEYPEGHSPKRNTRVMVALPYLESQLAALTAYLESLE